MTSAQAFLLGCVGALAPEVIRLYSIRTNPTEFRWSYFYVAVSTLLAALGGVVALVLPATTYWGALYAGISTPALVNVAAKRASTSKQGREPKGPANYPSYIRSFIDGL